MRQGAARLLDVKPKRVRGGGLVGFREVASVLSVKTGLWESLARRRVRGRVVKVNYVTRN